VGEVLTIVPLVKDFRARHPKVPILVTTVTETGQSAAFQAFKGAGFTLAFLPLDVLPLVLRVVARLRPRLFVFSENEVWPGLLFALQRRGIPTVMVNGRVSKRSLKWFSRIPLLRHALQRVSMLSVQSRKDYERLIRFGILPHRLKFLGNIKVDRALIAARQLPEIAQLGELKRIKQELGGFWVVGGSTHKGEEEALLEALKGIWRAGMEAVLILAPRHLERLSGIEAFLKERGFGFVRLSHLGHSETLKERVVLIDRIGALFALYALADVAFVGGSLVPKGGHNILEPLVLGVPVLFGEHTENMSELAQGVEELGLGKRLRDAKDLEKTLLSLARDPKPLKEAALRCHSFILEHQGALRATLEILDEFLPLGKDGNAPIRAS
jgi:3-deoxy-D-manno-octulosonic-acid transferase